MTTKEHFVRQHQADVAKAEANLTEAKSHMHHELIRLNAQVAHETAKLLLAVQRAEIELAREKAALTHAEAELARGFEV